MSNFDKSILKSKISSDLLHKFDLSKSDFAEFYARCFTQPDASIYDEILKNERK